MANDGGVFRSIGKAAAKKLSERLAQAAGETASAKEGETEAVRRTRTRVEKLLTDAAGGTPPPQDSRGLFTFPHESTRVFVGVAPLADDFSIVDIHAVTNFEVPVSEELFKFLLKASSGTAFGHIEIAEKDGKALVVFAHRVMGDFLQEDELRSALSCVALTGNKLDDEIQQRFGGKRFQDLIAERQGGSSPPPSGDDVRADYDPAGYL